jgi:hypothetical protein
MPVITTLPGTRTTPGIEPAGLPRPLPELLPIHVCPQQKREHASPDVSP